MLPPSGLPATRDRLNQSFLFGCKNMKSWAKKMEQEIIELKGHKSP